MLIVKNRSKLIKSQKNNSHKTKYLTHQTFSGNGYGTECVADTLVVFDPDDDLGERGLLLWYLSFTFCHHYIIVYVAKFNNCYPKSDSERNNQLSLKNESHERASCRSLREESQNDYRRSGGLLHERKWASFTDTLDPQLFQDPAGHWIGNWWYSSFEGHIKRPQIAFRWKIIACLLAINETACDVLNIFNL